MPRRANSDKFYQEWHIERTQLAANTDVEFIIDVPRPVVAPPAGKYWALEIHAIEHHVSVPEDVPAVVGYTWTAAVSLGTVSRINRLNFVSGPAQSDNIWWWYKRRWISAVASDITFADETRLNNKALYTDDKKEGKLLIGDKVYLQIRSVNCWDNSDPADYRITVNLSIEYTWTTTTCSEYVEELTSQLQEA